ncbi:MAG: alpha/beta hydrolase family protein [Defluviitaleaceae bacterium]|nr:alpha/beta hydrolase family protein [Defluviitaleaceae bacterium]
MKNATANKVINAEYDIKMKPEARAQLYQLLGDLPPVDSEIACQVLSKEERLGYVLEKLSLDLGGSCGEGERVPAYFVMPKHIPSGKNPPVVLFCHSHGGKYHLGKDELLLGNSYMYTPPYAEALIAAGYAALCIDSPLFGERSGHDELTFFKEMIWQGKVVWGLMVYDHLRAIDYLYTRDDVDATRLAALGMSMGSTMAWWLAALDERIKVCVDICCMTDFHALIEADGLKEHGIYYYVPGLLKYFDTTAINALIAPRPHLSVNGALDNLTPEKGMDKIDAALREIYKNSGAPDAWVLNKYPVQHEETADMRRDVMAFLLRYI